MDSELPTLLSDAESDGSLSSREGGERQYRNQAPGLISDSSAGATELWGHVGAAAFV